MLKEALRPAWVEINLSNLEHNITSIKEIVGERDIIAIVKADAYGHGAIETSKVLLEHGATTLGVATLEEAITLRNHGFTCPILILGLTPWSYHSYLIDYDLTPVVTSYPNARLLSKLAVAAKKPIDILIALETGMGRLGFLSNPGSLTEIEGISRLPNIRIKGLFSDFATADMSDKEFAKEQLDKFFAFKNQLESMGLSVNYLTMANSGAILQFPEALLSAVRPGILLYGCYPSKETDTSLISVKPVMSVKANLVYVKQVPEGTPLSYGSTFVTKRPSKIATLSLGYADGLPRLLSNRGRVIVKGEYAPIIGRVCMDQCLIDVTDIPDIRQYDEVVIMGSQGDKTITADEIACLADTINYEILCGFGQRLPKIFTR